MSEWTLDKFSLRRYTIEGGDLDKARRIEVIVKVDGKVLAHVQAREPGMVAFVSRLADQGFNIDIVEARKAHYIDVAIPDVSGKNLDDWQIEALGFAKENE